MAPETPSAKEGAVRWTSRSVGTRTQHRIFYFLVRYGGRQSAYLLLFFVALYYALFRPSIRAKAAPYLSRRFEGRKGLRRLVDSYRMFLALGKALIDRVMIGMHGETCMEVDFPERSSLVALLGERRGLLLMTAHVGCWQAAMASLRLLGVPVNVVLRHDVDDVDLHYYEHGGMEAPFAIIDPRSEMGGVMEIIQALKRGEIVCVMGDRQFGSRKGAMAVDFLGSKALFPFSAYKIASATGAPVAVLFSHKSGGVRQCLRIYEVVRVKPGPGMSEKELLPYVTRYVRALEAYTRDHPYQFFNFFDMWKGDGEISEKRKGKRNDLGRPIEAASH